MGLVLDGAELFSLACGILWGAAVLGWLPGLVDAGTAVAVLFSSACVGGEGLFLDAAGLFSSACVSGGGVEISGWCSGPANTAVQLGLYGWGGLGSWCCRVFVQLGLCGWGWCGN